MYEIASQEDSIGNLRIPAVTFPYFSEMPKERLQALEPIIMSKNEFGMWNYRPTFILDLDEHYNDDQIALMSKLSQYKLNAENLRAIAQFPNLNWGKTIEKAKSLNDLYGDKVSNIEFLCNRNGKNFLSADVLRPHDPNIPDLMNFDRVFALLDTDVNPISKKTPKSNIDDYINNIYEKMEGKLSLFTEEDFNKVYTNLSNKFPHNNEFQILSALQRLTQFANYSSLKPLSEKLINKNIGAFPFVEGLNTYFNYFAHSKRLFILSTSPEAKDAYFVNKDTNFDLLDKNETYIYLDGWDKGITLLSDFSNKLDIIITY